MGSFQYSRLGAGLIGYRVPWFRRICTGLQYMDLERKLKRKNERLYSVSWKSALLGGMREVGDSFGGGGGGTSRIVGFGREEVQSSAHCVGWDSHRGTEEGICLSPLDSLQLRICGCEIGNDVESASGACWSEVTWPGQLRSLSQECAHLGDLRSIRSQLRSFCPESLGGHVVSGSDRLARSTQSCWRVRTQAGRHVQVERSLAMRLAWVGP